MTIHGTIQSPEEIRAIRERLGLSQVEASELIGGGPRSFAKYEAGTVAPTAALINLLRILESNPETMNILRPGGPRATSFAIRSPFEVDGDDLATLNPYLFTELLRRLLIAEALSHELPLDGIHVAGAISTPDGGEDARIEWQGGPERTRFLPRRLNQFQLKAGKIGPATAAKDVLGRGSVVKDMIRSVVHAGGSYIMLCAHPYTQRQIQERKNRIREVLRNAGLAIDDSQIDFRDADQIATWVNHYPTVATWVKERTHPGTLGVFRSWSHWASRPEHDGSPLVEDTRLAPLRTLLKDRMARPREVVRVVGLSGVGTSRLTLEALAPAESEETGDKPLSDLVVYAVQSEVGSEAVCSAVQNLVDSGNPVIVVVDHCEPETHRILTGMAIRQSSNVSLVTIDHEIPPGVLDKDTLKIEEAPTSVVETIIGHALPGLTGLDRSRLAHFANGFPKIASRIARTWDTGIPLAQATDRDLVDAFVRGRNPREGELLMKAAQLLATFGLVVWEPPGDEHLNEIASLGRDISAEDLYAAFGDLVQRGVAHRRGRALILQPRPIAMNLAERQWQEWRPDRRRRVLTGDISPNLKVLAAQQLALLDTTEISQQVLNDVIRPDGPLHGWPGISNPAHARVVSALAEIDPEMVVEIIDNALAEVDDLTTVRGEVRRQLVVALEKIAFHVHTFRDAARLLLRLAIAENETWGNNATGQFTALFPISAGYTAADGNARLAMLDEFIQCDDPLQRDTVAKALVAASHTGPTFRILGAETQGSRRAMEPWRPATNQEATDYLTSCLICLGDFALGEDHAGTTARSGLGAELRNLCRAGFIDGVERVVQRVAVSGFYWPEAMRSLRRALTHDSDRMGPAIVDRIEDLLAALLPKDLESRLRYLVTEVRWNDPQSDGDNPGARVQRQGDQVRALAKELADQPMVLADLLPQLSSGHQAMGFIFGSALAEHTNTVEDWLDKVIDAVWGVPDDQCNFDLLTGFISVLNERNPGAAEAFKKRAIQSPKLAPAFLQICNRLGVTDSDVKLAIDAIRQGLLHPQQLSQWSLGEVMEHVEASTVGALLDTLTEHSPTGSAAAVELMGAYSFHERDRLENLKAHVLKLAESVNNWNVQEAQRPWGHQIDDLFFRQIMGWILKKGRHDTEATAVALALAKAVVDAEQFHNQLLLVPMVPGLLANFPEVAWPLIGQAALSDPGRAFLLKNILKEPLSFEPTGNAVILSLPVDTLFAWCHANPARAPAFAAEVLPILANYRQDDQERSLHPVMARLIDEFGEREDVREAIAANLHTFGWRGSLTTYFELFRQPMDPLTNHPKPQVRSWAKSLLRHLDYAIRNARDEDEEEQAYWEIQ